MSDTATTDVPAEWADLNAGDLRRMLVEEQAKRKAAEASATTAADRAAALEREQAFTAAGIPSDGTGALIRKAYDGEVDVDAIKAFAAEHGVTGAPASQPAPAPGPDPATAAAAAAVQEAAGGTAPPPAEADLAQRLAAAKTEAEVMALVEAGGIGADE